MDYLKEFMDEKLVVEATQEVLQWLEDNTDLQWIAYGGKPTSYTNCDFVSYYKNGSGLCSDNTRRHAENITAEEFLNGVKLNNGKFTKNMLVAGKHAVKLRRGFHNYLVLDNGRIVYDGGFMSLKDYNDNLEHEHDSRYDIVKVFDSNLVSLSQLQKDSGMKLVWERHVKTPEQLKMEEFRERQTVLSKMQAKLAEEMAELEKQMQ